MLKHAPLHLFYQLCIIFSACVCHQAFMLLMQVFKVMYWYFINLTKGYDQCRGHSSRKMLQNTHTHVTVYLCYWGFLIIMTYIQVLCVLIVCCYPAVLRRRVWYQNVKKHGFFYWHPNFDLTAITCWLTDCLWRASGNQYSVTRAFCQWFRYMYILWWHLPNACDVSVNVLEIHIYVYIPQYAAWNHVTRNDPATVIYHTCKNHSWWWKGLTHSTHVEIIARM